MLFLHIVSSVILPIFLLVGVGVLLDRLFKPDLPTLSKLNFYVFVPALSFVKILDASLPVSLLGQVGLFCVIHTAAVYLLSYPLFSVGAMRQQRTVLSLGAMFYNAGNYGIPLTVLAFGDSLVTIIAVVLMAQNLINFTFGIWLLERSSGKRANILLEMLKVPVIYAVGAGIALRALNLDVIPQVKLPLTYLADGLIPIALLTLGVQLSRSRPGRHLAPVALVSTVRLLISPAIAAGLVWAMGFGSPTAGLLIVAAGLPIAVNVYICSAEYRQDEDLASESILWTTLVSPLTISLLLALVR